VYAGSIPTPASITPSELSLPPRARHGAGCLLVYTAILAELREIARRYVEWKITGPPELREPLPSWFNPHRQSDGS
jgi:hypothetical protein